MTWVTEKDPWLTRSMHAVAAIARADETMLKAAATLLSAYLKAVAKAVLSGGAPSLPAFPSTAVWSKLVEDHTTKPLTTVFESGFTAVNTQDTFARSLRVISTAINRITSSAFPRDVFDEIRYEITQGHRGGESIPAISERVRSVLNMSALNRDLRNELHSITRRLGQNPPKDRADELKQRAQEIRATPRDATDQYQWRNEARRIARTESVGAYNAGSFQGAMSAQARGAEVEKRWLDTPDSRTRHTHRQAGGQTVPLAEPFAVGGASLLYPGDPTGPANEVIQCRCTALYVVRDRSERE